ncbi:NYN domain-containing protein [Alkalimarinus sediminis]|uniref:NYN domain-containing protein n=1 Tax=Alkalimarinus sediminis TaxID=1632866 RepID=A0A9E8KMM8_9ALTE|nr:NYN domain-containing protein [Alkalimarinus sediminis]UZW73583.1 NYN domain-containing protein [Alkalimarinus sediminis]
MSPKIALFVDVQNIYYTVRQAYRAQFNYTEFWKEVSQKGEIVAAYAYAIDRGDPKQRSFQNFLKQLGFEVKLKPYIQRSDGSAKGDWDVGIALDAYEAASEVDTVVLASGDGDFDLLALKVRARFDTRFEVYGVPSLTANSIIDAASHFNPIYEPLLMNQQSR